MVESFSLGVHTRPAADIAFQWQRHVVGGSLEAPCRGTLKHSMTCSRCSGAPCPRPREARLGSAEGADEPARRSESIVMADYVNKLCQVFISYRRDDSAGIAGRIYDRLIQEFGRNAVFKDVDSIPLGI